MSNDDNRVECRNRSQQLLETTSLRILKNHGDALLNFMVNLETLMNSADQRETAATWLIERHYPTLILMSSTFCSTLEMEMLRCMETIRSKKKTRLIKCSIFNVSRRRACCIQIWFSSIIQLRWDFALSFLSPEHQSLVNLRTRFVTYENFIKLAAKKLDEFLLRSQVTPRRWCLVILISVYAERLGVTKWKEMSLLVFSKEASYSPKVHRDRPNC